MLLSSSSRLASLGSIRTNRRRSRTNEQTHQATFENGVNEASIFCHNYRLEKQRAREQIHRTGCSPPRSVKDHRVRRVHARESQVHCQCRWEKMKGVSSNPFMLTRTTPKYKATSAIYLDCSFWIYELPNMAAYRVNLENVSFSKSICLLICLLEILIKHVLNTKQYFVLH